MSQFQIVTDPYFYILAVPAVLSLGVSKAGIGSVGGIGVPLMALTIPVPQAAAILLPLLCLTDLFTVWSYRRKWDVVNLRIILPGALIGTVIGTATFHYLSQDAFRVIVGGIAVAFTVNAVVGRHHLRPPTAPDRLRGTFWSSVSGFTSFVSHAGSPPLNVYMLPQRLDKTVFVGTAAIFYFVLNYAKIGPYAWLGQFDATNLWTSAVLVPLVPIGVAIGLWIHRMFSQDVFYRAMLVILFLVGAKLIYDGAAGFLA